MVCIVVVGVSITALLLEIKSIIMLLSHSMNKFAEAYISNGWCRETTTADVTNTSSDGLLLGFYWTAIFSTCLRNVL